MSVLALKYNLFRSILFSTCKSFAEMGEGMVDFRCYSRLTLERRILSLDLVGYGYDWLSFVSRLPLFDTSLCFGPTLSLSGSGCTRIVMKLNLPFLRSSLGIWVSFDVGGLHLYIHCRSSRNAICGNLCKLIRIVICIYYFVIRLKP